MVNYPYKGLADIEANVDFITESGSVPGARAAPSVMEAAGMSGQWPAAEPIPLNKRTIREARCLV